MSGLLKVQLIHAETSVLTLKSDRRKKIGEIKSHLFSPIFSLIKF